ncbi:MAG: DUF4388 domain-containing protein [bacterium]|nr:DUF4388 domain-containing protein [bacterium]
MAGDLGTLGDALLETLGLPDGDRLGLIEVGPTTVTLAREADKGEDLPRSAPALRAEIETFPLASVLRAIHGAARSGLLRFRYRDHRKIVYFERGEVVFASSNQRVDRLGECLLRAGVIDLEQLREAERRFQPAEAGDRFGKVLVECGLLSPRELWNGVKYQVEEVVRSLFAYASGTVWFWEGEVEPDNVVRLALETGRLVDEGLQRGEELAKFLTVLRDPRVGLARVEGFPADLGGNERALADAIGVGRSFEEVCQALEFDPASAARSIQLLRLVGAVQLMRLPESGGVLADGDVEAVDQEALRERVASLSKLISELVGVLVGAEGDEAAVLERLGRVLDDATGRFPALLTGVSLAPRGGLDADVLVARALKLPGNREEQLVGALGELVAYLEFELKNHPRVEDPDGVLESLRVQRRDALA